MYINICICIRMVVHRLDAAARKMPRGTSTQTSPAICFPAKSPCSWRSLALVTHIAVHIWVWVSTVVHVCSPTHRIVVGLTAHVLSPSPPPPSYPLTHSLTPSPSLLQLHDRAHTHAHAHARARARAHAQQSASPPEIPFIPQEGVAVPQHSP